MVKKIAASSDDLPDEGTLDDLLGAAEPAPPGAAGGAKSKKLGTKRMIELAAPLLARSFLAGKEIAVAEVWKSVPELAVYDSANALGTALSQGVGGKSSKGLKLWPGTAGYAACRQNLALAIKALSAADRDLLLAEFPLSAIREAMGKLPAATVPAAA